MSDGYVQLPADSTGKKVDTAELTRTDTTVVERQRIVLSDPVLFQDATVLNGQLQVALANGETLEQILKTLQTISLQLSLISGVSLVER